MPNISVDQVDALLPQTQCGLCEHGACRPYAEAMVNEGDAINRCPPGGERTLKQLANLLSQDATPYLEDMRHKQKPAQSVIIREDECIGCTKCIQACPVDAIMGAAKLMHTVIQQECTGCELCIEPCPVDCIDIIQLSEPSENERDQLANQYRHRYQFRGTRLARDQAEKFAKHQIAKQQGDRESAVNARKAEIQAAIARAKAKKAATI